MDTSIINVNGGAIALGHPLGATGAIRTATVVHGMRRTGGKYGMVTMCIGTGMGAAGIFRRYPRRLTQIVQDGSSTANSVYHREHRGTEEALPLSPSVPLCSLW
jgi:hypothetical protein